MTPHERKALIAAAKSVSERQREHNSDMLDELAGCVARHFGITVEQLRAKQRRYSWAKAVLSNLAIKAGIPHREIGLKLNVDHTMCSYYATSLIEPAKKAIAFLADVEKMVVNNERMSGEQFVAKSSCK